MVNDIRSSHCAKDEENKYGRVTKISDKGKNKSHPNVSDASGIRRSPRQTSSRRIISSPSTTCKSGQFEKGATPTPADKRKSEWVEKENMPSPLRRSGRPRSYSSTSHSDSRSSGSLNSNPKPKKEKSMRQLTFEAKEVKENEEHDMGTPQVKVKRMTAPIYRSLFELPKEEPNRIDKSNQGGNNIRGKIDGCLEGSHSDCGEVSKNGALPSEDGKLKEMRVSSRLSGPVKDLVENTITLDAVAPSNAATYEAGLAPEIILLDEDLIRNTVGGHRGERLMPSKRKKITVGVDSDVSATLAKGDNCNLISDSGGLSRISGKIKGSDGPSNATIFETGLVSERVQPDRCREETLPSSNSKNDVLLSEDGKSKEMRVDHGLSGPLKDLVENNVSLGSLAPSNAATFENGLAPESIQPDCVREETLQVSVSHNSILDEDLIRNSVGYDSSGDKLVPSKRKEIMVDMDSDVSATLAKGNNCCNVVPDCSSPAVVVGTIMGTEGSHSQRIRLDYNPTVSESCSPSTTELEDGDSIAASLLQKDSQIDNEKEAGLITNSINSVTQLKERLSSHNPYRCKSDSFRFVEYWVPVQISNMQLEQYCSILLSNASILRSSSKVDSVEAVRDVLISTRKCCSHPYLVGPELQPSLNKGLEPIEYLDYDLKASGKLQLLDSMLEELRKNDLRVLILFQSFGGSGRVIGNYLEDLLRLRFDPDSYERIDKNILPSKRQAAMKKFNDKNNRRFVFLLDTCACLPSIKLSSVDSIIIFDSDWNPINDIRSLQKITLDSQFEFIKVFRLYSTFTVEEKALILAKQCKSIDFNLQNINWSTSHMLLMWGASFLFDELKAFHDGETSASNVTSLFGRPFLKETMHEFSSLLSQDGEHIDSRNNSILLKVQQNGATYHGNFSLLGELKLGLLDEEPSQLFWTKLLDGKQFQWKYLNNSSQRSRKKVHHFDVLVNGPDLVSEVAAKKRRKVNNTVDQPSSKFEDEKLLAGIQADRSQGYNVESEQKSRLHDEQSSLHLLLKPEIKKLCDFLLLPDKLRSMTDKFLEYVMNNHDVNREPFSMIQAFQLSLCWTAASLLKHKLDPIASLIKDLNFECKKEEVDYIYSMLRCLKKIFLYRTGNYNDTESPKASEPSNGVYTRVEREVELFKKDMSKSVKEIRKKCKKKLKKLCLLQEEEKQRLKADIEEEEAKFEERYKIMSAVIRSCSPNDVIRKEKLRVLNIEYEKGIEELKCQHETQQKDLEAKQSADKQKFQDREAAWVEDVESWAQNELLKIVASKELGTGVESFQTYGQVQPDNCLNNHFAEGKGHDDKVKAITETVTENSPLSDKRIAHKTTVTLLDRDGIIDITDSPENAAAVNSPSSMEQESDGGAVNEFSYRELRPSNGPDTHSSPWHQNSGDPSSILNGHIPVEEQETRNELDTVCMLGRDVPLETSGMVNFTECRQDASPLNPPSSRTEMSDKGRLEVPCLDRVLSPRTCQAVCSTDEGPNNMSISNPLLEQQTTDGVPSSIPAAADCLDDVEHLTDAVLVAKRTTSEEQEGAPKTMAELSQESPVSRTVNVMDHLEQVGQPSIDSTPDHEAFEELQRSSEQPELVSSTVDVVPANQSNQASLIVNPVNQVQHLLSAELPSSSLNSTNFCLATEVEHQATVVPNQDVQSDSNLEHSHEVVVHPASNSDPNTVTPSEVRMQYANTVNSSIPLEINYQHMEAETHSASSKLHLSYYDPLKIELDRIRKVADQTMKIYEEKNMQLKSEFEKELEELRRKYDIKIQGIEAEFKQRKTTLDTSLNVVRMNQFLADAFRSKCSNLKPSCTSGTLQDSSFVQQHLLPSSRQQNAIRPSLVAGSSCSPSATTRQSPSTNTSSQPTVHPIRAGYSTSGFPPNASARSPIINTISLPVGNLQPGGEIRAPAPHLQPYRP